MTLTKLLLCLNVHRLLWIFAVGWCREQRQQHVVCAVYYLRMFDQGIPAPVAIHSSSVHRGQYLCRLPHLQRAAMPVWYRFVAQAAPMLARILYLLVTLDAIQGRRIASLTFLANQWMLLPKRKSSSRILQLAIYRLP